MLDNCNIVGTALNQITKFHSVWNKSVVLLYMRFSWVRRSQAYLIQKQLCSLPAHIYYSKISLFHPHFLPSPSLACLRTPSHETPIFLYIGLVQEHTNKKRATSSHSGRVRKKKVCRCLVVTQPILGCWVSSHKQQIKFTAAFRRGYKMVQNVQLLWQSKHLQIFTAEINRKLFEIQDYIDNDLTILYADNIPNCSTAMGVKIFTNT